MVGVIFEDLKGLNESELYNALTDLANTRSNAFGFTEAGQSIYDLAEGLKFKILTKEDIVGSDEKKGMLEDFAEEIKDDGISPEVINKVLVDKFRVGKKYVIETDVNGLPKGKYIDDGEPQDLEAYLRKPKEEIVPEVKEDFTEKVIMGKITDKINDLDKKYPELLGKDTTIEDAIELKKELERERKELEKEKKELVDPSEFDGLTKDDFEDILKGMVKAIKNNEKTVDDFVSEPGLKQYKSDNEKLFISLQQTLRDCINEKGE